MHIFENDKIKKLSSNTIKIFALNMFQFFVWTNYLFQLKNRIIYKYLK